MAPHANMGTGPLTQPARSSGKQSPTWPAQPSLPEMIPQNAIDPTAFTLLSYQVQQLHTGQTASQHQMQQLYVGQQAVQMQIQQLISQLQGLQPKTTQPTPQAPQPQQQQPGSSSQPALPQMIPPGPQCTILTHGQTSMPSGQMVHPSRSLTSYFPDVRPALLLAILKHDFNMGHLFKLDPQMKDRSKDSALQLSDTGILIRANVKNGFSNPTKEQGGQDWQ